MLRGNRMHERDRANECMDFGVCVFVVCVSLMFSCGSRLSLVIHRRICGRLCVEYASLCFVCLCACLCCCSMISAVFVLTGPSLSPPIQRALNRAEKRLQCEQETCCLLCVCMPVYPLTNTQTSTYAKWRCVCSVFHERCVCSTERA